MTGLSVFDAITPGKGGRKPGDGDEYLYPAGFYVGIQFVGIAVSGDDLIIKRNPVLFRTFFTLSVIAASDAEPEITATSAMIAIQTYIVSI